MKKFLVIFAASLPLLLNNDPAFSWGFYAHKRINRMAVFTLPEGMSGFYKQHIEYLTEHAVDPDKRRYAVDYEAPRHYIDIDHYGEEDCFEVMPRKWMDAIEKYSEDTLNAYGIVPWHLEKMVKRLTWAFKEGDAQKILSLSADLGHYVGDAHVPLHTTENYNGQQTNQKGIHGFWESRLPELKAEGYDYWVGKSEYLENPLAIAWETVEASHAALDSVLLFEAQLNKEFPSDQKYSYETRGATNIRVYSLEYSEAYNLMLDGMVERRMRKAIIVCGSFWYTAWVNAGQPDLRTLMDHKVEDVRETNWKVGKIYGRDHE